MEYNSDNQVYRVFSLQHILIIDMLSLPTSIFDDYHFFFFPNGGGKCNIYNQNTEELLRIGEEKNI